MGIYTLCGSGGSWKVQVDGSLGNVLQSNREKLNPRIHSSSTVLVHLLLKGVLLVMSWFRGKQQSESSIKRTGLE